MNQENILDKIVRQKKLDLELRKKLLPISELILKVEKLSAKQEFKNKDSFFDSLSSYSGTSVIAEVKRVSPSKGPLRPDLNPIQLAQEYQNAGARAVSVLTEEKFFKGSDEDLTEIESRVKIPILRKDFTVDEYQVWEAKLLGASAVLLIAAVLSEEELIRFANLAQSLSLDVLFEVHNREETLKVLKAEPRILGINNRNLKTFQVTLETSKEIIQEFKSSGVQLWVSESGIYTADEIKELKTFGFKAFLIGESLLRSQNPEAKLSELIQNS